MHRLLICVVLAVLLVTTLSASCPKSSCASWDASLPVFWLNTSTMNTRIHGPVITFYARQPNGEAYTHMPAGLAINYLGEVETHAAFGNCSGHTASGGLMTTLAEFQAESRVARYLNLSEACCDVIHKTGEPVNGAPGVTVESYIVNITHPAYPDFYAEYIASTPDTSYTIEKPGTEEIGSGYNITSDPTQVKIDLNLYNFPWIGNEQPEAYPNNTYLVLFLTADTQFDKRGTLGVTNDDKLIKYQALTSNARIRIDLLKVYTTDGVDHFSPQNNVPDTYSNIEVPANVDVALGTILSICQGPYPIIPRWKSMNYDPSLDALFLGALNGPPNTRLSPAAYAVPVAVVGVIIVLGAIYAFVIRPRQRGSLKRLQTQSAEI